MSVAIAMMVEIGCVKFSMKTWNVASVPTEGDFLWADVQYAWEGGEQEVKRILKNSLMKLVANAGYVVAKRAVGSASIYGYHQPKEPKIVDRLVEKTTIK